MVHPGNSSTISGVSRTEAEPSAAFECVVSAEVVRRAMLATSTEETRYYLHGVHVSPHPDGGAYVVGTDGVAMAIFHDEKAHVSGSAILSPDGAVLEALVAVRGDPRERLLVARQDRLLVTDCPRGEAATALDAPGKSVVAAQYRHATIDGKYPDWRKVFLPLDPAGTVPVLDARLLSKLAKALCVEKRRKIALRPTGPDDSMPVWAFGDFPRSAGIIMGLRGMASHGTVIPGWLGEVPKSPEVEPEDGTTEQSSRSGRNS